MPGGRLLRYADQAYISDVRWCRRQVDGCGFCLMIVVVVVVIIILVTIAG